MLLIFTGSLVKNRIDHLIHQFKFYQFNTIFKRVSSLFQENLKRKTILIGASQHESMFKTNEIKKLKLIKDLTHYGGPFSMKYPITCSAALSSIPIISVHGWLMILQSFIGKNKWFRNPLVTRMWICHPQKPSLLHSKKAIEVHMNCICEIIE